MINTTHQFAEKLKELDPRRDEFIIQVDDLVEETEEYLHEQLYDSIFRFFERCPEAYCGAPGTLVHMVERYYPNYVESLCQSVKRKPSVNTVLMLNRILNARIPDADRKKYMDLLDGARHANGEVGRQAEHFIAYQNKRQSEPGAPA